MCELGFRVPVTVTVDTADTHEQAGVHDPLDALGLPTGDGLVRPIARQGFADHGIPDD
jgi:hypothetical protein